MKKKCPEPKSGQTCPNRAQNGVFVQFLEFASLDFAHFPYLDRLDQYLQLLYWHHGRKKMSRGFRGHFRSKIRARDRKSTFFKKIFFRFFFSIFFDFSWKVQKNFFTPLWGQVTWDFHKKIQNRNFSNSKPFFFEFESSDRSDIAYYASIKWVEAFAIDPRSRKNLIFA